MKSRNAGIPCNHKIYTIIFVLGFYEYIKNLKAKLESAYSFMLKYSKITVCDTMCLQLHTYNIYGIGFYLTSSYRLTRFKTLFQSHGQSKSVFNIQFIVFKAITYCISRATAPGEGSISITKKFSTVSVTNIL